MKKVAPSHFKMNDLICNSLGEVSCLLANICFQEKQEVSLKKGLSKKYFSDFKTVVLYCNRNTNICPFKLNLKSSF